MRESPLITVFDGDKLVNVFISYESATSPQPNVFEKEVVRIFEENKLLRKALSPFVQFKAFLDALRETQHEKPLTEHSCIVSAMGSGGSDYIWYGDLTRAEKAIKGT